MRDVLGRVLDAVVLAAVLAVLAAWLLPAPAGGPRDGADFDEAVALEGDPLLLGEVRQLLAWQEG